MKPALNTLLRALCLFVYLMAALRLFNVLPEGWFNHSPWVAAVLLGLHVLELLVVFPRLKLHPGGLGSSVVLTLLFGVLHWKPMIEKARAEGRGPSGTPSA